MTITGEELRRYKVPERVRGATTTDPCELGGRGYGGGSEEDEGTMSGEDGAARPRAPIRCDLRVPVRGVDGTDGSPVASERGAGERFFPWKGALALALALALGALLAVSRALTGFGFG
jgi:hypothetical protein